jgi:NAD(P)-dependent dehydrogenase (short-subunit alcohol dehydrogenase family)
MKPLGNETDFGSGGIMLELDELVPLPELAALLDASALVVDVAFDALSPPHPIDVAPATTTESESAPSFDGVVHMVRSTRDAVAAVKRALDARRTRLLRHARTEAEMGLLEGKVAIVTGAGNGIGRAEAMLFAKEGASVVVNDVGGARDGTGSGESPAAQVVAEIVAAGGKAVASFDTVATVEGARRIVDAAVTAFGRVDVLVNNAGILRDKSLLKMDEAMWDSVIAVHLKGTFLCSQAAAKQMIAQGGGGRIVNTTSVSGMMGNFGQANYAAAKAGIYGLTRTCAIELQKHRVTVNAIAPIAKTRLTEDLPMFQQGMDTLTPEHVAPAALFLASDLAGDKTGHVLAVAGAQMYAYKVVQTAGKFKDEDAPWTAQEIADNWESIVK